MTVQRDLSAENLKELADLETKPDEPNPDFLARAKILRDGDPKPNADENNRIKVLLQRFGNRKQKHSGRKISPPLPSFIVDEKFRHAAIPVTHALRTHIPSIDDAIVNNIYLLSTSDAKEEFWGSFFIEIGELIPRIQASNWTRLEQGLVKPFEQLALPYKTANSIGGYKGFASEILAALRGAASVGRPIVRLPPAYKRIDPRYATVPDKSKGAAPGAKQLVQDIDRTELLGRVKYYIEVKADTHTAVQKHGKWESDQIKKYKEVIQSINTEYAEARALANPDPNSRAARLQQKTEKRYRVPVVEITNPQGWFELFTAGTADMYGRAGVWLFIDGQRFSSLDLRIMVEHIKPHLAKIDPAKFPKPADFEREPLPKLEAGYSSSVV